MAKTSDGTHASKSAWMSGATYDKISREVNSWPQWKRDAYTSIGRNTYQQYGMPEPGFARSSE